MKKRWSVVIALLLIANLLLMGCSSSSSASGTSTAGDDGWYEKPEFNWKMQVIHGVNQTDFKLNQQAAELVYQASKGRMKIEVVPNGTFVSSAEGFQACGEGVFEMHSSWPMYAKGIEYALLPLSTGSLTMDAIDKYVWIYEAGGWDLLQKAFDKLNLHLIAVEIWGSEVMMAQKPFKSIADMKGSKMRTSDPRLLETYGAAGITLPLEEVFTAMATGSVEAAEFGHLKYNEDLGLVDVSKYAIYPDFWNVHFVTTVVVNKDAWNKLPDDLKLIVEMAFKSLEHRHYTSSQYESAQTMKKLQETGKLEVLRMDPEGFAEARRRMYQIEQEDAQKYGGLTKETYDSINKFQELWYPYKHMSRWWGWDLTPEEQLGYTPSN